MWGGPAGDALPRSDFGGRYRLAAIHVADADARAGHDVVPARRGDALLGVAGAPKRWSRHNGRRRSNQRDARDTADNPDERWSGEHLTRSLTREGCPRLRWFDG